MKRLILGLAVLPFLAGISMAGTPTVLTDKQMDQVTAGFHFFEVDVSDTSLVGVGVNDGPAICACYLNVEGTTYPSGVHSLVVIAVFGP